ncbi:MAG: four helix bundle protein, partial [Opitutae bacterium]|nr:four helix bundle protein [Opitutae bacterium]
MELNYRNKNRGYQRLLVWQDAIELYGLSCRLVRRWPFEMKRIASQTISSSDSVHRNIAEGYCRRSVKEYLHHLNIALGSLGETMSGFVAYVRNDQITEVQFKEIDQLIFRLENRLDKLEETIQRKGDEGEWEVSLDPKEDTSDPGLANGGD